MELTPHHADPIVNSYVIYYQHPRVPAELAISPAVASATSCTPQVIKGGNGANLSRDYLVTRFRHIDLLSGLDIA